MWYAHLTQIMTTIFLFTFSKKKKNLWTHLYPLWLNKSIKDLSSVGCNYQRQKWNHKKTIHINMTWTRAKIKLEVCLNKIKNEKVQESTKRENKSLRYKKKENTISSRVSEWIWSNSRINGLRSIEENKNIFTTTGVQSALSYTMLTIRSSKSIYSAN